MTFESHGVIVGVRTTSREILPEIEELLPPGSKRLRLKRVSTLYSLLAPVGGRPGLKRFNILFLGALKVGRSLELAEVLEILRAGMLETVAHLSREKLFVRGGVVEKDGKAIVLAGPKGSGTTTLVKAFLRAGATYHSDEYALVDRVGKMHPFGSSIEGNGSDPGSDGQATTATPDARRKARRATPVGCILFTRFRDGARFRPKTLTPGEAMLALLSNTTPVRFRPRPTIARLRRLVGAAPALRGVRGEADEVVARVLGSPEWKGTRS